MKRSMNRQGFVSVMILALLLAMAIPATAMGQGRGKGRGHNDNDNWGNNSWRRNNKKCQKFRNCHDARDGRWDGRGPSGNRVGNSIWRNRNRNRNWDGNRRWRLRRARLQTRY